MTIMQTHLGVQPCSKQAFLANHMASLLPSMPAGARQRLVLGLLGNVYQGDLDPVLLTNVHGVD